MVWFDFLAYALICKCINHLRVSLLKSFLSYSISFIYSFFSLFFELSLAKLYLINRCKFQKVFRRCHLDRLSQRPEPTVDVLVQLAGLAFEEKLAIHGTVSLSGSAVYLEHRRDSESSYVRYLSTEMTTNE